MTHTPGPWVASPNAERSSPEKWLIGAPVSVTLPAHFSRHVANAYDAANARLIAAAPDMLEALETLYRRMTDGRRSMSEDALAENAEVARAAIAKAREA